MISSSFLISFGISAICSLVSILFYVLGRLFYSFGSVIFFACYFISVIAAIAGASVSIPILVLYLFLQWILHKSKHPYPVKYSVPALESFFPGVRIHKWHLFFVSILFCASVASSCYLSYSVYLSYDDGFYDAVSEYEPIIDSLEDQITDYKSELDSSFQSYSVTTSGNIVYVTDTGDKYHRRDCSYLDSRHAIRKSEAIEKGYSRCSRCNP